MTTVEMCLSALLALVLASSDALAEDMQQSSRQEDDAHGHHFYSERLNNGADLIDYVVCNKTDVESDFFWTGAAFGISQLSPLPAHHCLEKKDYLNRTKASSVDYRSGPATVYVRDKSAEVLTVYWCEFKGLDRCDDGLLGSIVSWSSTLREFAEGASDKAFQPSISVDATLEEGAYRIEIRRSEDTGQLLVIAKSPPIEGVAFLKPNEGIDVKLGSAGDFLGPDQAIAADLSPDMPAALIFSPAASDAGVSIYFLNRSEQPVPLAIFVSTFDGVLSRIDTIPLPKLGP